MRGRSAAIAVVAVAAVVCSSTAATPPASAAPLPGSAVINEISYHPFTDGEEFVELTNPGDEAFDVSGACFTAGITGCLPADTEIAAHGYLLVAELPATLATVYPSAPAALPYGGSLSNGGERITLSLGADVLDTVAYDDEGGWPLSADGSGPSLELIDPLVDNDALGPWRASDPGPTPGAENSTYGEGPPPEITDVQAGAVAADQPVAVTASIVGATSAQLEITVGFDDPQLVAMADDGAHDDGAAADGVYGASIPGQVAGTLVRYRVLAASASGSASFPASGDPRPRIGFIVERPPVDTDLPVIDWYIDPDDFQYLMDHAHSNDTVPTVVAVGDEVWDGTEVRVSGNGRNLPKYSFKFNLPKGHPIDVAALAPVPVDEFILDGDPNDAFGALTPVGFSIYRDSEPAVQLVQKVRVERNGEYHGLFTFVEEPDATWEARTGLDGPGDEHYQPEGSIGVLQDEGSADALLPHFEKVSPDDDYTSLYDLVKVIDSPPTPERAALVRDTFDLPALIEFLATGAIVQHWDTTVHNWELVREGDTGRWRFVATDMDFVLGLPVSGSSITTWLKVPAIFPCGPDNLVSLIRSDPELNEMYFRRLRTLAEELLAGDVIRDRVDAAAPALTEEVVLDRDHFGLAYDQPIALGEIYEYLAYRENDLLVTHRRAGEVPAAATPSLPVVFSAAEHLAAGGPDHDFVELFNPSFAEAIDLSGWTLEGAGTATLPPGTVLAPRARLVVAGDPLVSVGDRPSGTVVAGALIDGLDDAGGQVWVHDRQSVQRGQATLGSISPPTPPAGGLSVEASVDQVEVVNTGGSEVGVKISVAVTNGGAAALPGVTISAGSTTCGRSLGTLAAGSTATFRCTTTAGGLGPDRTYRIEAKSGVVVARSAPLQVRQLQGRLHVHFQRVAAAPKVDDVVLGPGGTLRASVALPPATGIPVRWLIGTGLEPGRGVPTVGSKVAPADVVSFPGLPVDRPIRFAVGARNLAGTGARSPLTPFLTPRSTMVWPFASTEALVRRVFEDLDGRDPTATELSTWIAAIDGGASPSDLIVERLAQPGWAVTVEPLLRLYQAYFGRPPDPSGLAYWIGRRRAGVSLSRISAQFAGTSEFRSTYGSLTHGEFVELVYDNVLGRAPDAGGLSYWVRRLEAGTSRGTVMTSFSESNEGRRVLAPDVSPLLVSIALLGEIPSVADLGPAHDWMLAGGSLRTVIDAVRTSDAYASQVGP